MELLLVHSDEKKGLTLPYKMTLYMIVCMPCEAAVSGRALKAENPPP